MSEQELAAMLAGAKRYIRLAAMLAVVLVLLTLIDVQTKRAIVEQVRAAQRLLSGLTDVVMEADRGRTETAGEARAGGSPVPDAGDGVGGAAAAGEAVDPAAANGPVPRPGRGRGTGGVAARPRGHGSGTGGASA